MLSWLIYLQQKKVGEDHVEDGHAVEERKLGQHNA
jgi:hypothetical protein